MVKVKLIGYCTATLGILIFVASYIIQRSSYFSGLLVELGSLFFGLGLGVLLVNFYLDLDSRREAVQALLRLVGPSIIEHHDMMLSEALKVFGKQEFSDIVKDYVKQNGDPKSLKPADREKVYNVVKTEFAVLRPLLIRLESDLRELTSVVGWSFSVSILRDTIQCRFAIVSLLKVDFDDSPGAILNVCEHFLDIDLMAHLVFEEMRRVGGLRVDDVYES